MTTSELGVGIIGAGSFGAEHAKAVANVSGASLVAASAPSPRIEGFVGHFGGRGYTDYHDLLDDPSVDVVCIALPNHLHAEATVAAASAGKAVLLEKPLAVTASDAEAIVDAIRTTGVAFMVGYVSRFIHAYSAAIELLHEGRIGRPVVGTAAMVKDWGFELRRPWHLEPGGGMWLTNGCHLIDRLCLLLDDRPRLVSAVVGPRFHDQESDDVGVGVVTFDAGAVGIVKAVGYRRGVRDDWTEVQGTEGALRVSHTDGLYIGRDGSWEQLATGPSSLADALCAEWGAFLRHARGEEGSPIPVDYGWLISAVVLAGIQSSESGKTQTIAQSGD